MVRHKNKPVAAPQPGWAVYLRTSSDENQKPELSRARQRFVIEKNVLERSELPVYEEYVDVLSGKTPVRKGYQKLLEDARLGKFSFVVVERADRFGRNDTEALRAIDELYEFGVSVRFANSPDLDPMDPDDRVIVTLSFTLARRESALLGIRVKGGLQAKRQEGGYISLAPDGYINVEARTSYEVKKFQGRVAHWIEQDPERAPMWRYAWDLLLEDRMTLEEIAEALHEKGYRYRSGRSFVSVTPNGKRKANVGTLSSIFHNWSYAGWIVSERNNIPPKTLRGKWEPIVSTEEFERGLEILERRNQNRKVRRKQEYLLSGMIYYSPSGNGNLTRLTCSTSNAGRSYGGTPYYRVASAGGVSFLCSEIDSRIAVELKNVQIDPELIPLIREVFQRDLAERIGWLRPDERTQIEQTLKAIDEEEARTARLYASGKITESIWDSLWTEWQDRRNKLRSLLESLKQEREVHINNLDTALKIVAKAGVLYNSLEHSDQKELLHQMVERVVINPEGNIQLELRAPFAYLKDVTDEVRRARNSGGSQSSKRKTGEKFPTRLSAKRSNQFLSSWGGRIRTYECRIQSPEPCRLATPQ